jgi:hypothetical protein
MMCSRVSATITSAACHQCGFNRKYGLKTSSDYNRLNGKRVVEQATNLLHLTLSA